ncbi:MAG TPA: TerC/Alx family metal homeostasis membrane protein [Microbacteriaceae bacterium]|nr:TerC/Alx family metal homeostasis membrane protein [Microbacteriaceae bacterium]
MMTTLPLWFESTALTAIAVVLALDLVLALRRPRIPSNREAATWVGVYVVLALVFAGLIWAIGDVEHASQFLAGWVTEYSLSVDNLFVFIVIMSRFAVPRHLQQEVLMIGILMSLVLRGGFILVGAALIERFSWVFYLFGGFLIWVAIREARGSDDAEETDTWLVRTLRRRMPITDGFHGLRLHVRHDGARHLTPMLLVLLAIGTTDVLFALDSIPAIFGITQSAFIVFSANVFALMGLRQLYFLLGNLLERLEYLRYGITFVLGYIGLEQIAHALHTNELPFINGGAPVGWVPEVPTLVTLAVIVGSMTIAAVASLVAERRRPT